MNETESLELITDRTLVAVFFSVFISSGTAPVLELIGYSHPAIQIGGVLIGATIAMTEARKVRTRIDEAKEQALLGTGFAPGFFGN